MQHLEQAFLDGAFTVPGDGCIDYVPFLNALKKKIIQDGLW